jgi:hypothetical protein
MAIMWEAPEHPATSVTPIEVAWTIYLAQAFARSTSGTGSGRLIETAPARADKPQRT